MRTVVTALALASVLPQTDCAQGSAVIVPSIGCPADGQMGFIAPPRDSLQVVSLDRSIAQHLAYYRGENVPGVFAPRGWHCQVWYGSSGRSILVSAAPIDSGRFERLNLKGQAIEFAFFDGGTSGRFAVARYASRLFTRVSAAFVEKVKREGIEPDSEFESRPYKDDSVRYSDGLSAEFTTPASRTGIGTEGDLAPSDDVIRGFAVLDTTGDWGISVLRIRLGPHMDQVVAAIIKLNLDCVRTGPC